MTRKGAEQWGVFVDECGIFSNSGGADWWAMFWMRFGGTGRIVEVDQSIAGGLHHVGYDDKDDAAFGREYMAEQGIHPKFVKVMTLSAARKMVQRRHKTSYEPGHSCMYCAVAS